jgi:NADPH:quinone reductase-like Zn-dependent oxidoreductase
LTAIQFARLSGFSPIIVTASAHNTELLQSLGATHIIPRSVPLSSLPSEIAKITTEPVEIVFDSISLPETQLAGINVLAPNGTIIVLLGPTQEAKDKAGSKEFAHVFGSFAPPATRPMGYALTEQLPTYIADGLLKVYFASNWLVYVF